jgi:putative ABC transport system substrate-binding protein
MRRREFLVILGGAVLVASDVSAQPHGRMSQVGVLTTLVENDSLRQALTAALREGLAQLGWTEERNIHIEFRWYIDDATRARVLAKELVDMQPDLIFTSATPGLRAVWQETRTIPIVFVDVTDPVGQGFVESLARPGGNVTGFTNFDPMIGSKWLEVLREISPGTTRIAILFNPITLPHYNLFLRSVEAAAQYFSVNLTKYQILDAGDFSQVTAEFARGSNGALLILPDIFVINHRKVIIELAARHSLPAVYPFRFFAQEGGLVSYGTDSVHMYREAATYVDRILRGAKPSELPIQASTKFELVINLRTAKRLGLTISPLLLARADEVIE